VIVVLDASAGIEIALRRAKASTFNQTIIEAQKVISSDLYKIEVTNTIWKYVQAKLLTKEIAKEILRLSLSLVDHYIDISENNEESLYEAIRLNHSTYDMLYFTLARRNAATLLTLDKHLAQIALDSGIDIIS
jgi:predicted nucleic acid-binding protein